MTEALELAVFAGVMVLGQFSPGPDMILLTRTALREGRSAGLRTAVGIATGLTVHATLAVAGMAVLFTRFPAFSRAMQWVAAAYLLWIAWRIGVEWFVSWYSGGKLDDTLDSVRRAPFLRGLFCNLLNPKVALFLAAVCAPFLNGDHPGWWPAAIWAVIVGLGIGLWSLWVLALQWPPLRGRYQRASRWIDALFAFFLVMLAVRLVVGW